LKKTILKYQDLNIDAQFILNLETKLMPIITGTTGTISPSFK